ncbi:zinc finger BED domain-containing protein DAYSLEEPER-like [Ipomoea triloba]|uniref:zinc finger BED domain-containing protein DAYSLEEPER-like n=1 Tax=Ipomoea triloba TaxID=35885 RepID=UPI00125DF99A|nr:zinc finger BED domain-containing protein DAYSLEEPER-like [Ipomoea triloba]
MENISGLSRSQPEVEAPAVETNNSQSQQPLPPSILKKRKEVDTRSLVWDHFEKIKNNEDIVIKAKCLYCLKMFACQSKKHGTSSMRNHILNCLKNPHSKDTRESLLTFQPAPSSAGTESSQGTEGVSGTWVFDQDLIRRALAEMIIVDELPFRIVEGQGFRKFVLVCCPMFKIPSRWTINRDIFKIFSDERINLKKFFRTSNQRVSITTDTWTSVQRINYMCITAHFIDSEWKLQKKIISFVSIYSHNGENIAKALESCLLDWGLKLVFNVTVDNASSNDTALGFLKKKLVSWGCSNVRSKYLHMRCIAHIFNLVVQDGLKECDSAVKKVRDVVRHVRSSPARVHKFRDLSNLIEVEAKNSLCLDVPTRWNSTYMMQYTALLFQKVFEVYEDHDNSFKADLDENILDFMDWESIASLVKILKSFYEMTVRISGSLYVTANTFFSEVSNLSCLLKNMMEANGSFKLMDPRDKIEYMPIQFNQLYGEKKGKSMFDNVMVGLKELFEDYVAYFPVYSVQEQSDKFAPSITSDSVSVGRPQSLLKSQIKKQRFPVLSKMARDLLVVPISTVASESAFSTSGRELDSFRSSLTPKIVEALVCAQDWLRLANQPISVKENIDDVERIEKELCSTSSSRVGSSLPTILVCAGKCNLETAHGLFVNSRFLYDTIPPHVLDVTPETQLPSAQVPEQPAPTLPETNNLTAEVLRQCSEELNKAIMVKRINLDLKLLEELTI